MTWQPTTAACCDLALRTELRHSGLRKVGVPDFRLIELVGDWERALPLARQVAEYRKSRDDYTQPATLEAIRSVMNILISLNQFREAEQIANECLDVCSREFGADHPQTIRSLHLVAKCKYGQGDLAEAGTLALQALERAEKHLPVDHPFRGRAGELLVDIHIGQGEYQKAEALILDRLADSSRRGLPVGWVRAKLALCQARQGNLDEADSSVRQALRELRSDPDHATRSRERQMAEYLEEFPKCFEQAGRSDQAEYWRQQLSELRGTVAPGVDADPS